VTRYEVWQRRSGEKSTRYAFFDAINDSTAIIKFDAYYAKLPSLEPDQLDLYPITKGKDGAETRGKSLKTVHEIPADEHSL
jgi:hypothetical protein